MINIDGYNIEYPEELKEFFRLDKVFPLIKAIIMTDEMFDFEGGSNFQHALRYAFESAQESFPVTVSEDGVALVIDGNLFPIRHTPKETFTGTDGLGRKDTLSLILCELVEREYKPEKENHGSSSVSSFYGEIRSKSIKRAKVEIPVSDFQKQLSLREINNVSDSGFSYVILEDNRNNALTYQLNAGNRMFLLSIGDCPVNKIPQFSVSSTHVNYLRYTGDSKVKVCCIDFRNGSVGMEHTFEAEKLTQVCADEKSGFIALLDGEIVSYSDEIQPEDIEDLMLYIPGTEKILMIQLRGRQLFALTDAKKVYSNYKLNTDRNEDIIWIAKAADGEIRYIHSDDAAFPLNSDRSSFGKASVVYNNGNISR